MSGHVSIENVSIELGNRSRRFTAVENVSLQLRDGEFACVLGPSGCGKSTLLGALAGHLQSRSGSIYVDREKVTAPHPERGLVFQHHTLFPWLKVIDNVAFGLKMKGIGRDERRVKATDILRLVDLADSANQYPWQLSGGQQQRVELARVLVNHPRVLLMDEPFGALDAITRLRMQQLLLDIWRTIGITVVFVTHDIDEALYLADRIFVMSPRPGKIIEEIVLDFERPRSAQLLTTPRFAQLKSHCLHLLHGVGVAETPRLSPIGDAENATKHLQPTRGFQLAI